LRPNRSSDAERLEFLRSLHEGDIVVMVDPGPEHIEEGLYTNCKARIARIEGHPESYDVFLFLEGRNSKRSVGCFPERVMSGPVLGQMELF